jgi:hypothetical protein
MAGSYNRLGVGSERYEKYDPRFIRENPKDQFEEDLARSEAEVEANKFFDQYANSPKFRKRLATAIAKMELGSDDGNGDD